MNYPDLASVRSRVFDTVATILARTPGASPQLQLDVLEETLIQIADSEHSQYPEGVLIEWALALIELRRIELALLPFPSPDHDQ